VSENTIDTENRKDVWQPNIVRTGKFSVKDNHQSGFDPHWHKLLPELRQQTVEFGGSKRCYSVAANGGIRWQNSVAANGGISPRVWILHAATLIVFLRLRFPVILSYRRAITVINPSKWQRIVEIPVWNANSSYSLSTCQIQRSL
jgi:hypothetical protein